MAIDAAFSASVALTQTGANDLGTITFNAIDGAEVHLTDGVAAGMASKIFADGRSLTTGATENLDLAGVLLDPLGNVLTFTAIKAIWIETHPSNTTDLTFGNAASNGWVGPFGAATHTLTLKPGAQFMMVAPGTGWAVTAGTADLLKVLNSAGATALYNIVIVGI